MECDKFDCINKSLWPKPNIGKDWGLFNIPLTLKLNG